MWFIPSEPQIYFSLIVCNKRFVSEGSVSKISESWFVLLNDKKRKKKKKKKKETGTNV